MVDIQDHRLIYEIKSSQLLNIPFSTSFSWTVDITDKGAGGTPRHYDRLSKNFLGGTDDTDLPRNSYHVNYFTYWNAQCPIIDDDIKKGNIFAPTYHLGTGENIDRENIGATICCRFSPLGAYADYLTIKKLISMSHNDGNHQLSLIPWELLQYVLNIVLDWLGWMQ